MYNGFVGEYNSELNQVFSAFLTENINHLVLDLRYNSGGNIRTATELASMITGQFYNQVFTILKYNESLQSNNQDFLFTNSLDNNNSINSLNLNKIYVLTSNRSASASEMIINSLKSYINVVQIGDQTVGKSQASQIVYDSQNLSRNNVNSSHTYALLPLIAITVNKNDETVPSDGIAPSINIVEKPNDYGLIGDTEEPLLKAALLDIQGSNRLYDQNNNKIYSFDISSNKKYENIMYVKTSKK
jgi:C-terminal processing protease CtpA/Prc